MFNFDQHRNIEEKIAQLIGDSEITESNINSNYKKIKLC